jgi:hypothetical protein
VTGAVVLDGQLHPVPHEIQIALNGLVAHLQRRPERGGIRITARLQFLMNPQHPLHRRPGIKRSLRVSHDVRILRLSRPIGKVQKPAGGIGEIFFV